MFDDDWDASVFLYPRNKQNTFDRPPVTLLVMSVNGNIIFDPSKEELSVAEVVLAVSVGERSRMEEGDMDVDSGRDRDLRLLTVRTIDPPSRLTHPGVPNALNTATGGVEPATNEKASSQRETMIEGGVWLPPRGGAKREQIAAMIQKVLDHGGVAEEVLAGLDGVELG